MITSLLLCPLLLANGPCGPLSGGRLDGAAAEAPAEWSACTAVSSVQVETRPDDPYSVTTWCVTDGATLYVPSRNAADKPWVQHVLADPRVRVRIGDAIYERRAVRVDDAEERRRVIALVRAKYTLARWFVDPDPAESPDTWFFRLEPRG